MPVVESVWKDMLIIKAAARDPTALTSLHAGGQVADRMSKGIREAPTKALMGELAVKSGDRPEQAFGAYFFCNRQSSEDVTRVIDVLLCHESVTPCRHATSENVGQNVC